MTEKTVNLVWHYKAREDLESLDTAKQEIVIQRVNEFEKQEMSYKYFGRVTVPEHGFDKYKIKYKEEEPVEINQRLILCRYQGYWWVLGIAGRDDVYKKDFIEVLKNRDYT